MNGGTHRARRRRYRRSRSSPTRDRVCRPPDSYRASPTFVWLRLRIALGRVLPKLLTAKSRHIEIAPGRTHRLIAAPVDEISAEDPFAVLNEGVMAVPLIDAKIDIEAVSDRVPGDPLPPHARLQARNVPLRRAGRVNQRDVARVEVRKMRNLVSLERATTAAVIWPAMNVWLEECAVDDQLPTSFE
jgi:hypothetical protein